MPWLINPPQLDKFLKGQKNIIVLDATWRTPDEVRPAQDLFVEKHIASARFLDLNAFVDSHSEIPNMLTRDEQRISELVGALGITPEHKIIFYDNSPMHTSCRALWMFKVFGHHANQLYILDGGLAAWERYGGKVESGEARSVTPKSYPVNFQAHFVRSLVQMKTNQHHPQEQVVDVRHPVRFAGGAESKPGLRAGHMPGSYSFPFMTMFESDGKFKSLDKIRKQFMGTGVDLNLPIVTSCGSGTTAPILNFVLDLLEVPENAVYDGSWSEWGAEKLYPGEESLNERPVVTSLDS